MSVTIEQIVELRKITNCGISDCKKALEDANGDIEEAVQLIRKRGKQIAAKRTQNNTTAGITFSAINRERDFAVIGSVRCETDFGVNSSIVSDFIKEICEYAIKNRCKKIDEIKINTSANGEIASYISINEALEQVLISQIREKVVLEYDFIEGSTIFTYTHFNKRVSVLLKCDLPDINDSEKNSICSEICLQVACCDSILGISREDVKEKEIEAAMDIATEKAKNAKNDTIKQRIIDGYMNEFYKETVLVEMPYKNDDSILIKDLIKKNNIKIIDYKRLKTF